MEMANLFLADSKWLDRLSEYFKYHCSWPGANVATLAPASPNLWEVSLDPPTGLEVKWNIRLLRRQKSAGPNKLLSVLFKLDGESLVKALSSLFYDIWDKKCIPLSSGGVCSYRLYDLGYPDPSRLPLLDSLYGSVRKFGMRFAPPKCQMLL